MAGGPPPGSTGGSSSAAPLLLQQVQHGSHASGFGDTSTRQVASSERDAAASHRLPPPRGEGGPHGAPAPTPAAGRDEEEAAAPGTAELSPGGSQSPLSRRVAASPQRPMGSPAGSASILGMLADLTSALRDLEAGVTARLDQQDQRIAALEAASARAGEADRSGRPRSAEAEPPKSERRSLGAQGAADDAVPPSGEAKEPSPSSGEASAAPGAAAAAGAPETSLSAAVAAAAEARGAAQEAAAAAGRCEAAADRSEAAAREAEGAAASSNAASDEASASAAAAKAAEAGARDVLEAGTTTPQAGVVAPDRADQAEALEPAAAMAEAAAARAERAAEEAARSSGDARRCAARCEGAVSAAESLRAELEARDEQQAAAARAAPTSRRSGTASRAGGGGGSARSSVASVGADLAGLGDLTSRPRPVDHLSRTSPPVASAAGLGSTTDSSPARPETAPRGRGVVLRPMHRIASRPRNRNTGQSTASRRADAAAAVRAANRRFSGGGIG